MPSKRIGRLKVHSYSWICQNVSKVEKRQLGTPYISGEPQLHQSVLLGVLVAVVHIKNEQKKFLGIIGFIIENVLHVAKGF